VHVFSVGESANASTANMWLWNHVHNSLVVVFLLPLTRPLTRSHTHNNRCCLQAEAEVFAVQQAEWLAECKEEGKDLKAPTCCLKYAREAASGEFPAAKYVLVFTLVCCILSILICPLTNTSILLTLVPHTIVRLTTCVTYTNRTACFMHAHFTPVCL
jgi:hypothetical protein